MCKNNKKFSFRKKHCHGFTLIELLISITIAVAIAGVAVPMLNDYSSSSAADADDEQLKNAIQKARNFARANNRALQLINEPNRIRVLDNNGNIIGVYPIEYKTISFSNSDGDSVNAITVTRSGTFNDENIISIAYDNSTNYVSLLRSGRFSSPQGQP